MRFVGRASGVHHVHSLWLAGGDRQVGMADASEKSAAFLLKTVLVLFPPNTSSKIHFSLAFACLATLK